MYLEAVCSQTQGLRSAKDAGLQPQSWMSVAHNQEPASHRGVGPAPCREPGEGHDFRV